MCVPKQEEYIWTSLSKTAASGKQSNSKTSAEPAETMEENGRGAEGFLGNE